MDAQFTSCLNLNTVYKLCYAVPPLESVPACDHIDSSATRGAGQYLP